MIPNEIDGISIHPRPAPHLYGVMAEFDNPESLALAAKGARAEGYRVMDAFTPYPIEEISETVVPHHSPVPKLVFLGGLTGALTGFGFQCWTSMIGYPMNIGGRPYYSWPSFIIVTFELTILFAASSAVFGMFFLNKLPMPYHPVFNVERFARASKDRFFLLLESRDPMFDAAKSRAFLDRFHPVEVSDVHD